MSDSAPVIPGLQFRPATPFFFCDESGRTGSNVFDPNQPVHVLAGYLLGEHQRARLRSCLNILRSSGAPGSELKAKTLLRTPKWAGKAAECIVDLNRQFAPIIVVLEKRYYAAVRLSEALFPKELPVSEPELARTPESEQRRAEIFAKLPTSALATVIPLFDAPSRGLLKVCISTVVSALKAQGETRLAELVENQQRRQKRIMDILIGDASIWKVPHPSKVGRVVNAGNTPDLDTFLWCINRVNDLLEHKSLPACRVVFDESECEEAFKLALQAIQRDGRWAKIRRVEPGQSDIVPELQAADLLAGCTRAVIDQKWPGPLAPAEDAILSNFFNSDFLTQVIGTKDFVDKLKLGSVQPNRRRQQRRRQVEYNRPSSSPLER